MKTRIDILFVCLGNICRSPMAEYIMRDKIGKAHLENKIFTDSAGTAGYHDGDDMHSGTADMLDFHHIDSSGFVSRKVRAEDWQRFDYLIAMDEHNLHDLQRLFGKHPEKLFKITDLCPDLGFDHIPDPWYSHNFKQTYELLDRCCDALLLFVQENGRG